LIARSQSVALDPESYFTSLPNLRLTADSLAKEFDYQIEGLNAPIERLPITSKGFGNLTLGHPGCV
jgi:hypothetical protein